MIPEDHKWINIENTLEALPFVSWDRFTCNDNEHGENEYTFYGWIDREQDSYKDFVLINFTFHHDYSVTRWFTTSSAKYSLTIHQLLEMDEGGHEDCLRVEDYLDISNAIKL